MARKNNKTVPFTKPPATTPAETHVMEKPTDDRLLRLLKAGTEDFCASLVSNEDQIRKDIERIEEEAGEDGKKVFKIGISLGLNLATGLIDTAVSYSVKVTDKRSHPNTPDDGTPDMFSEE